MCIRAKTAAVSISSHANCPQGFNKVETDKCQDATLLVYFPIQRAVFICRLPMKRCTTPKKTLFGFQAKFQDEPKMHWPWKRHRRLYFPFKRWNNDKIQFSLGLFIITQPENRNGASLQTKVAGIQRVPRLHLSNNGGAPLKTKWNGTHC